LILKKGLSIKNRRRSIGGVRKKKRYRGPKRVRKKPEIEKKTTPPLIEEGNERKKVGKPSGGEEWRHDRGDGLFLRALSEVVRQIMGLVGAYSLKRQIGNQ